MLIYFSSHLNIVIFFSISSLHVFCNIYTSFLQIAGKKEIFWEKQPHGKIACSFVFWVLRSNINCFVISIFFFRFVPTNRNNSLAWAFYFSIVLLSTGCLNIFLQYFLIEYCLDEETGNIFFFFCFTNIQYRNNQILYKGCGGSKLIDSVNFLEKWVTSNFTHDT